MGKSPDFVEGESLQGSGYIEQGHGGFVTEKPIGKNQIKQVEHEVGGKADYRESQALSIPWIYIHFLELFSTFVERVGATIGILMKGLEPAVVAPLRKFVAFWLSIGSGRRISQGSD